jgi:predicted dehydrogenase
LKQNVKADIVAIATQDSMHKEHAVAFLEKGYDLLLEKPIATSLEEVSAIYETAVRYNRKVIVCHVLRYTPFYRKVKEIINSGVLGKIVNVSASENVGFYHQAHSFVRGPWKNSFQSSPMILAKCCHDMDILRWLIGKKCLSVASFGELSHFKKENQPSGAGQYCSDCKIENCIYKAQKLYVDYKWMAKYYNNKENTDENILNELVHTDYDKCVYDSDNNVVDHQCTIMQFEEGVVASHTMTAFSKEIYRDLKIHGTKAELCGNVEDNFLELRVFGGEVQKIDLGTGEVAYGGHSGGDMGMMHEVYMDLNGEKTLGISYIDVSIDSHKMAFGAEKARLAKAVVVL